jgi:hypothetical protein
LSKFRKEPDEIEVEKEEMAMKEGKRKQQLKYLSTHSMDKKSFMRNMMPLKEQKS